jgi:hypothetical protein
VLTSLDSSFDPLKLIHVTQMHRRLWFTEKDSPRIWYLPVDQVQGVVKLFSLGEVFPMGGYLQCAMSWSVDTGAGMDDQSVFISSKGNIAVYNGFDPDSLPDFTLVGVYTVGATIGRRCACPFGSDVAILTEDGVVLLTGVLAQSKMLMQPPLTDMIQHKLSDDVNDFATKFGWELLPCQRFNQLYINVPADLGTRQYVMNTITGAWATISGYAAQCFAKFMEEPFFGAVGYVAHAWNGNTDDPDATTGVGKSIQASCLQAFSNFGSPRQKIWNMVRPIFTAPTEPRLSVFFDVDYEINENFLPVPPFQIAQNGPLWNHAVWDRSLWAGGFNSWKRWFSLNNIGFSGAIFLKTATANDTSWVATDFVYLEGNIL